MGSNDSSTSQLLPWADWLFIAAAFVMSRGFFLLFRDRVAGDLELYYETYRLATGPGGLSQLFAGTNYPYPPLVSLFLILPGSFASIFVSVEPPVYYVAYRFGMILFDLGTLLLVVSGVRQLYPQLSKLSRLKRILFYFALPVVFSLITYERVDIAVAFLIALSVWNITRDHVYLAALALGLGIAFKLTPVLLLPPLLAYVWTSMPTQRWTRTFACLLSSLTGIVIGFLPFILFYGLDSMSFLYYQGTRGIQIESILSSVALLMHLAGFPVRQVWEAGAYSIRFPGWHAALTAWTVAGICLLGYLTYRCWRQVQQNISFDVPHTVAWMSLFLIAGICVSKVFSPQFLIWLFPLIPLLPARYGVGKKGIMLFGIIYLLTVVLNYHYYRSLIRLYPAGILALSLRNAVLLGLAFYLWRKLETVPFLKNRESIAGPEKQDDD